MYSLCEKALAAVSLDFGLMYTEREMMLMKTVTATSEREIEVLLNLVRRELVVKFPLSLPSNSNQGNPEIELFKFRIPLDRLKQIYVEKSSPAHRVLMIPLDSPPEIFRQTKDIQSSHNDEEKTWNEWQTWFRQTDVVEDRAALEAAPARFRKDNCVIDIGKL
jgi:RNA-dependent RNA polymerase